MKLLSILFIQTLALTALANPQDPAQMPEEYFKVGGVSKAQAEEIPVDSAAALTPASPSFGFTAPAIDSEAVNKIINIGKALWKIVEAGKPSNEWRSASANAIPQEATSWQSMNSWRNPKGYMSGFGVTNLMQIEVVRLDYTVVYTYGGTFQGRGAYLKNVSVAPQAKVRWGWNLDAEVRIVDTVNVGTEQNPIAGMELHVKWKVWSALNEFTGEDVLFVRGDGELSKPVSVQPN